MILRAAAYMLTEVEMKNLEKDEEAHESNLHVLHIKRKHTKLKGPHGTRYLLK